MGLPGVDVFEQIVPLDVLDGVDPQGVDAHVQVAVDAADQVFLDVLPFGSEINAVAGEMLVLQRMGALPIPAGDEALLMVPGGVEPVGVDAEEAAGLIARLGHGLAGLGIHQGLGALGVAGMALPIPIRGAGVIDVVPVRPGIVAQVALVGTMVDPARLRALGHIVFDGQVVDPRLAADTVLAGVVDDHVLDDLDAPGVGGVDEVLIGGVRGFQPWIDPRPVVAVVAVIVEAGAVLDGGRDPDGAEPQVADVVQAPDQPLEIPAPMGIHGIAGGIEADAVSAEEIVGRIPIVESGGEQEIDGFLPEIRQPGAVGLCRLAPW